MAADYEAGHALSSIAALWIDDFALQQKICGVVSTGSRMIAPAALQSFEPISPISHLHIVLVRCTRVSNSNRMPVSGIDPSDTLL